MAVNALECAGEQALLNYANEEAVKCFSEAIRISEKDGKNPDPFRRARWERQLAEAYYALGYFQECIAHSCAMLNAAPSPRAPLEVAAIAANGLSHRKATVDFPSPRTSPDPRPRCRFGGSASL